jgi:sugar lactone lactonase YvrE
MGQQSIIHPFRPARLLFWTALACLLAPQALAQTINATTLPLILPSALAFDSVGNLYLAETGNHVIRKVDPQGRITILAGTGTQGFSGDNGLATAAQLDSPQGLAFTSNTLYIADTHNHRVRRVDLTTGIIITVAGTGTAGYSGEDALAGNAALNLPTALTVDILGNLYLADTANHRIRKIDAASKRITTIAGNGTQGYSGDAGPATAASIDSPTGIAVDALGNLYIADTHNHRIRKIASSTHNIATLAFGTSQSALVLPQGLALDTQGNVYVSDVSNHRILRIDAVTNLLTIVAGTGTQSYSGDAGLATAASLDSPRAVAFSPTGQLTLSDTHNQRIRQLDPLLINTVAGLGMTIPGTLSLTAPAVLAYGTGRLTATLNTPTAATGNVTFFDTYLATTTALAQMPFLADTAALSLITLPAGTHMLVATYPGDLTHIAAQSNTFSLTITPATTTTTLVVNGTTLGTQTSSTTTGVPTGTLSILDATAFIAKTTLGLTGASSANFPSLAPGTHTLTATYAGDHNFLASTSTPISLTIDQPPASTVDFTLTANAPANQTVLSGSAATYTFLVQTSGGLTSPITLNVSGLPLGATATISPSFVPPGTATATVTLVVTTLKAASVPILSVTIVAVFLPLLCYRKRRSVASLLTILSFGGMTLTITACGDRINTASTQATKAPATYTITFTGTATSPAGTTLTHSATVNITLQ